MLTTSLDGLWVLQVLTGIEVLSPELGLRPHFPSAEDARMALAHPVAEELRAEGVIGDDDAVDPAVVEWLTVISRRDIALLIQVHTPVGGDVPEGVLLCRFAQWWATLERSDHLVRLSGAGTSTAESTATSVVTTTVHRLCGANTAARLRPVTLDADALIATVDSKDKLRQFLVDNRVDADQQHLLMLAADPVRSAQASIVAMQSGVESGLPTRAKVEGTTVTIIDTPEGRMVAEHVLRSGKRWMILSPGTDGNIATAINHMLRRLPANQEWFSYRKVV